MVAMEILQASIVLCCLCVLQVSTCPKECECSSQQVNCYDKKLRQIPLNIPADTMKLNLGNNEIEQIDVTRFKNLTKLYELLLKYNQITSLEAGTFKYLKNLENLDLGINNIKTLAPEVFSGLSKLKGIDLTENFIENIDDSFQNLPLLERLDLGGNKIKTIGGMAFNDLKNLIYLVLPNNEISKIDRFAFRPLQKLSSIILNKNPLKIANALFVKNRQLSYIDLTQCALTRVPSKLPASIQYLQLRHNNITRIKINTFSKNKRLGILVLDQNEISVVDKGAFSVLKNLQQLWLNDNKLTEFPSPISQSVKTVYISKNKIQELSNDDFPDKSQLVTLSLRSNEISNLQPGSFSKLKNLDKLYLDKNNISVLKNRTFYGLTQLSSLSLNKNFLTNIEKDVFVGLKSLTKLEMAFIPEMVPPTKIEGNILSNIKNLTSLDLQLSPALANQVVQSRMLSSVSKLKDINLMDNNLLTLNSQIRTFLKNADVIKLAGNLWHCDKSLIFFKEWINSNSRKFFLNSQITCSSPNNLRGKKISKLKKVEFAPTTKFPQHTTTVITTPSYPVTSPTKMDNNKLTTTRSFNSTKAPDIKATNSDRKQTSKKVYGKQEWDDLYFFFTTKNSSKTPRGYVTMVTKKTGGKASDTSGVQRSGTTAKVFTRKLYIKTKKPKQTTRQPTNQSKGTTSSFGIKTTIKVVDKNKTDSEKQSGKATESEDYENKHKSFSSQTESIERYDTTQLNPELSPSRTPKNEETLNNVDQMKNTFDTTHDGKNGGKQDTNNNENNVHGNSSDTPDDELESSPEADQTKAPGSNGNTKIAIIATCVSVATLVIVILAAVLVHRQYRKNKLVYHRALQYRQDYTDVTFFVGEPVGTVTETDFISKPKPKPRKRSDRGSTSSMTKEDITNDLDQSMKVYTWDDDGK